MEGSRPLLAEVQALVASTGGGGSPRRAVSGLDAQRVAMVNAVVERRGGVKLADADVFAASVGGVRIAEPAADLALALAIASAAKDRALPAGHGRPRRGRAVRRDPPGRAAPAGGWPRPPARATRSRSSPRTPAPRRPGCAWSRCPTSGAAFHRLF